MKLGQFFLWKMGIYEMDLEKYVRKLKDLVRILVENESGDEGGFKQLEKGQMRMGKNEEENKEIHILKLAIGGMGISHGTGYPC